MTRNPYLTVCGYCNDLINDGRPTNGEARKVLCRPCRPAVVSGHENQRDPKWIERQSKGRALMGILLDPYRRK